MAKNILQKKKRIAHFQRFTSFTGGENDYVSSIIQSMDSNFSSIHLSGLKDNSESVAVSNGQRGEGSETAGKSFSQNSKKITKFTIAKKFPLMEKSQKVLKQLKHNRKIPKPRAHMARSPMKRSINYKSPIMSNVKKKEALDLKNVSRSSLSRNPSSSSSVNTKEHKAKNNPKHPVNMLKEKSQFENFKTDNKNATIKVPKTINNSTSSGSDTVSPKSTHAEKNILTNSNILEDSEENTSDSEYERFVKQSKKGLRKKNSIKQKQSATKRKACSKKSKRKAPKMDISEQSESCNNDIVPKSLSSTSKKTCSGPKPNDLDEALHNTESVEEFELDAYTRDSSESDMEDSISPVTKPIPTVEEAPSMQFNAVSLKEPITSSMHFNADSLKEPIASSMQFNADSLKGPIASSMQFNADDSLKESIASDALPNLDTCANNCVNNFVSSCNSVISSFVNNSSEHAKQITTDNSLVIDLCDSDDCDDAVLPTASENTAAQIKLTNAGENTTIVQNVHPNCEDSDLEVIEVIHKETKCVTTFDPVHMPNKIVIKPETCLATENTNNEISPVIIKTEGNVLRTKNISEAVYTTDICTDVEQSAANSECSKAIKREKEPDDVIVLETYESNSVKKKIKTEASNDSKENIQKACKEISCTDKASGSSEVKLNFNKFVPMSTLDLLELYKKEFEIYLEMREAEANVEASLKNLQIRQAEKVKFIRSLLNKYIPGPESSADKPHVNKSVDTSPSQYIPSLCLKDSTVNNIEPSLCLQDCAANDIKPLLCLQDGSVNDIKPDINMLNKSQVVLGEQLVTTTPKLEPGTVHESSSSKSETDVAQEIPEEKCNVCGKEAIAACQRCAKVFFCSHECGKKFWIEGHENECGN